MSMEILSAVLFIVVFFTLVYWYEPKTNEYSSAPLKVHRHGHRCYMDGLNPGEVHIVKLLAFGLSHKDYFIFNNLIVPTNDDRKTAQIDHVVVSRFGVFVIESKQYSGWIFANSHQSRWTQTLPNGAKFYLQNPLLQNYGHVSALREHLNFVKNRFFNVVVFSGDFEFKTETPQNVVRDNSLVDFIKSKQTECFKEVELLVILGMLAKLCQTVDVTAEEHVENVREHLVKKGVLVVPEAITF